MNWMILSVILVRTLGDISFKKAMNDVQLVQGLSVVAYLKRLFSNVFWWLGLLFGFLNIVFWIMSLNVMALSQAYLFLSLSYVVIILAGKLLFHEGLDREKLIGIGFIFVGSMILFFGG